MKKTLEQIQAEFHQDAETLATLQGIYAERVKQIRTNRAFPPDIQQRFLVEWEQFYDQRVKEIFNYDSTNHTNSDNNDASEQAYASSEGFSPENTDKRSKR